MASWRVLPKLAAIGAAVALVGIVGLFLGIVVYVGAWTDRANSLDAPVVVDIATGSTFAGIARDLEQRGVVDSARMLSWLARWKNVAGSVHTGEYQFDPGATPTAVLRRLAAGDVVVHQLRILEGWTVVDMLGAVGKAPALARELDGADAAALLSMLEPDGVVAPFAAQLRASGHAEGLFFPDTYYYEKGDADVDLLRRAYHRMQAVIESEWRGRAIGLPYDDAYDALIMASIIEKETGVSADRAKVGGVFVRRLQRNMMLQTDPSVIYGLGVAFDGNLTRAHLDRDGPYNSYKRRGLPPTPIALPGRASIGAALHPAQGTAMYFVARGDGTSYFSDTLDEHLEAVRRYQLVER